MAENEWNLNMAYFEKRPKLNQFLILPNFVLRLLRSSCKNICLNFLISGANLISVNKSESFQVMSEEFPKYLSDGIFHKVRITRNSQANYFRVLLANNMEKSSEIVPPADFSINLRTVVLKSTSKNFRMLFIHQGFM